MGVTKYILKHPVTTVMALLCLVVFGISSAFSAKLEQMPEMETPMLIIMANYSGAGPEDISELVIVLKHDHRTSIARCGGNRVHAFHRADRLLDRF